MPVVACCLICAFSSLVAEAAAGADGEVAAGRAPVDVTGPERDSLALTLVPGAGVRLRSPTAQVSLTYTPRIFYRVPNVLSVERPLLLHQVGLDHDAKLSPRLSVSNAVELSAGELDYTSASLVFDPAVSSVRGSVAEVLRTEAQTSAELTLTRRLDMSVGVSGDYTTSLGDTPSALPSGDPAAPAGPDVGLAVPDSASGTVEASLGYSLSRFDRISASTEVSYQWFADGGRFVLISPNLSWESQLSRRTSFGISGGLAYVITLEDAQGQPADDAIGGTGSVQIGSELYRAGRATLSGRLSALLDWFFDPLVGTSQPRAGAEGSLTFELGRDWSIAPTAAFYAVLRAQGQAVGTELVTPDATVFRAELPIRYEISPTTSVTFGGRTALRGRAITQDGFRLDEQVELWAFVALTFRMGTGREDPSWLSL